jgi:hypothetical protein
MKLTTRAFGGRQQTGFFLFHTFWAGKNVFAPSLLPSLKYNIDF